MTASIMEVTVKTSLEATCDEILLDRMKEDSIVSEIGMDVKISE